MNLYEAKTGIVLKQRMVAEKAGELTHLKDFLTPTLLKGRIISADALYTQKAFCQQVIASGGDYLLFVKHHQPILYEDVLCWLLRISVLKQTRTLQYERYCLHLPNGKMERERI